VHQSEIKKKGFRSLTECEQVSFQLQTKEDGNIQAINVKPVKLNQTSEQQEIVIDPNETLEGTCKAWANGFGFIYRNDGGPDVFVHQSEVQKSGFRALKVGEAVQFKLERRSDGNIQAVGVVPKGMQPSQKLDVFYIKAPKGIAQFHPQQIMLDHNPILYKPEQLFFHPMTPAKNVSEWQKMAKWKQPGFYSCYPAQCYQSEGNYWAGVSLSTVAKKNFIK